MGCMAQIPRKEMKKVIENYSYNNNGIEKGNVVM